MSYQQHEKKRHRAANSGGVPIDAYRASLTLATAMNELRPKARGKRPHSSTELTLFHLYFLYLWITGSLEGLTDAKDIPTLALVTATADCRAHCLRRIRTNGISWIEYAVAYPCQAGTQYLWQPFPSALNPLFSYWLTHHDDDLALTQEQKQALFWTLKGRKWRAPAPLRHHHMLRKDRLFSYLSHEASIDPFLSTPAKTILIGQAHHGSAIAYQKLSSNHIRYEIFCAHNRYLGRLASAINENQLSPYCELTTPSRHSAHPLLSQTMTLPAYLQQTGAICAYHMEITEGTRTYIELPATYFGSHRALAMSDLNVFFHYLHTQVASLAPLNCHDDEALRHYHNAKALELSLLFVLLTGTRPTHHISIERQHCFDLRFALIKDKGRYRSIELCDHLKGKIQQFQALQRRTLDALEPTSSNANRLLWYWIDEANCTQPCRAKQLRQFMVQHWQACFAQTPSMTAAKSVVPYQLRHSFAQHALLATNPRLTTQQVDSLMGHSNVGEHLGDHYSFSAVHHVLSHHLAQWAQALQLDSDSSIAQQEN
ncbi:site-specific integrase [Vibrio sp. 1159]|uniref:site-specific integrase n=1 Tax=Vibrio sp. 1159 TaxID=3074545 RepID=UPI002964F02D|nr:site-specific integrase [Vibrio sp. 1159]MDW2318801.1 site-specific integrase [Vibrio sp. 1159]